MKCLPQRPLRVAIDVGHSLQQAGAISARGTTEFSFNDRFARELIARSEPSSALQLFRLGAGRRQVSLRDRPRAALDAKAHLFLSIHHDAVQARYLRNWTHEGVERAYSDRFRGYSLFVWEGSRHLVKSLAAARLIARHLKSAGHRPTLHHAEPIPGERRKLLDAELGIYAAPFAVLVEDTMPSILFEVGVIVHRDEELELDDASFRARLQSEVISALIAFCRA